MFIAIEGMDGTGKSTQIKLLQGKLLDMGKSVVITREPGGSRIGDQIREILLNPENKEMQARTEALLYAASRAQHLGQTIIPALNQGKIVISDRYVLSSYVYQGLARGLGVNQVKEINEFAIQGKMPDLTIFLFVSQEVAIQRKKAQKELDRLEAEDMDFHRRVNQGFYDLAQAYAYPKLMVNTDEGCEAVQAEIWQTVKDYIERT